MRRPARLLATVVATAAPVLGLLTPAALTTPAAAAERTVNAVRLNGYEAGLLAEINTARRNAGLRSLVVAPGATDVARRWSWHLAHAQALSHNPSLVRDLEHSGSSAWTDIAENVGTAPSNNPDALFRAYMASPPHRANILDRHARYIGLGVVERGTAAWNTLDFTDAYSTAYGRTRVPPAALTMDRQTITANTDVASLENPDQRFGTTRSGNVSASLVHFTGPTTGNDAATATFTRHGSGYAQVMMRDALDLSHATSVKLQIAAHDPLGRAVSVGVYLDRAFGTRVYLGNVRAGARRWVTLTVPSAGRNFRSGLILRVGSTTLGAVGGKAQIVLLDVRATV